jgi:uncharacterized protein
MDTVQRVVALYEAFGRGDLATIVAAMHPDIEWISNGDPALLPWGGTRRGIAEAKTFFAALAENLDFEAFEPREFLGGADFVTVIGRTRARVKRTGRLIDSEWAHVFRFAGDKLASFREFYDTHEEVLAFTG